MTTNQGFPCGHENLASHRFCGVCGAARQEVVAASSSQRQSRVPSESRSTSTADSRREEEVIRWANARRGRLEDDPLDDLEADEDRRRRPLAVVAMIALVIAVVAAVGYVALSQHTVFLERVQDKRDARVSPPVTQPQRAPAVIDPAPPPRPATEKKAVPQSKPTPPSEPEPARVVAAPEAKPTAPPSLPPRELPAPEPARQTTASAPPEDNAEPAAPSTASSSEARIASGTASSSGARDASSTARSSEERMAAFLVDELGAKAAARKALSNANWYEEGRSERQYWYRVAAAVTRRGGR